MGYAAFVAEMESNYPWWAGNDLPPAQQLVPQWSNDAIPLTKVQINNNTIYYDVYDTPIPEILTTLTNIVIRRGLTFPLNTSIVYNL